jgi:hypothetical protein
MQALLEIQKIDASYNRTFSRMVTPKSNNNLSFHAKANSPRGNLSMRGETSRPKFASIYKK